ncbi:MAG: type II toxin-antitoxin system HicB family antitoxin [Chloroflexi bacterium]|nr:type II toxin-antitoxin system HicB family antitoxin [Chloroflexota bacterium]
MKLYKLSFVMHEPSEDTEGKFMAEIHALPGCRAWGDTAAEALENLQSVAAGFIESYRDRGDQLPPDVEAASLETSNATITSEVLIVV